MLFLSTAEVVMTADTRLSGPAWATLSMVLLPSAQTLKAVLLLMSSARGLFLVCCLLAPCCRYVHSLA